MDMCELCFSDVPETVRIGPRRGEEIFGPKYVCKLCRHVAPRKVLRAGHQAELSNAELLLAMLRLGNEILRAQGVEVKDD